MGRKGATDAEVIDAAKKCGCHEFIMGLENGYQTVCGASGGHLSGGERQRISIATCHAEGRADRHSRRGNVLYRPGKRGGHPVGTGKAGAGKTLAGHCPTGCPPLRTPIRSLLSIKARSKRTGTQAELLASCPLYQTMWEAPHISVKDDGEVGVMLQTLKKFFAFCGVDNRRLFITSIWLGVVSAICSAMRITGSRHRHSGAAGKERHYGNFMDEPRHYRDLIDHYDCHQHEGYHAPDPCGLPRLRQQTHRDRRAPALPAYGLVQ